MDTLLNELHATSWPTIAGCAVSGVLSALMALWWFRPANRARQAAQDPATPLHQALTSLTISISQRQDRLEQELAQRDETITSIAKGSAEHCLRVDDIEAYLDGKIGRSWRAKPVSLGFARPSVDSARIVVPPRGERRAPSTGGDSFSDGTRLEVT